MPGLSCQSSNACSVAANGFWSNHDDLSDNKLQKFWSELSLQARKELLLVDKQALFDLVRKNSYCAHCHGLLLDGFVHILMYGKTLERERDSKNQSDGGTSLTDVCQDEVQDPSVHPWGGLTSLEDGSLTLVDCYICSKSIKGVQNVFDSARARERERELLYPDACGGGGRCGRGHGMRESCALHTARILCDTLVDFWSALGEDSQQSLLEMHEEDFMKRLMYRFERKKFCRDCRRNVLREFKELRELKRMQREARCTSWFCAANTAFKYEVSDHTVQADWRETFTDTIGMYDYFEWAVGTGEGKSDILEFENVGMNVSVQVNGLDLGGISACYVTLRAWKLDGHCTELSVEAHALKGQQCVHRRLVVDDGYVTITRGESIKRFFEHAEEAEEEEEEVFMDNDGNELDGECSRPLKHAKSPELAREFLLDAATVIFKEQVEKAFRDGTTRQNAHNIFVCLALKLMEERIHVAFKEIITLENQTKLLEEEEREKREEEERRERRRTKEKEKKLRRKERLKGKGRDRERSCSESNETANVLDVSNIESPPTVDEEPSQAFSCTDSVSESDDTILYRLTSPEVQDELLPKGYASSRLQKLLEEEEREKREEEERRERRRTKEKEKKLRRKERLKGKGRDSERSCSESNEAANVLDVSNIESPPTVDEEPSQAFSCTDSVSESDDTIIYRLSSLEVQDELLPKGYASSRLQNSSYDSPEGGVTSSKDGAGSFTVEQSNFSQRMKSLKEVQANPPGLDKSEPLHYCDIFETPSSGINGSNRQYMSNVTRQHRSGRDAKYVTKSDSALDSSNYGRENCGRSKSKTIAGNNHSSRGSLHPKQVWEPMEPQEYPRSISDSNVTMSSSTVKIREMEPGEDISTQNCPPSNVLNISSTSGSDNCSSCRSEGDSNTASSSLGNMSDSEDASQHSEGRGTVLNMQNSFAESHEVDLQKSQNANGGEAFGRTAFKFSPAKTGENSDHKRDVSNKVSKHQGLLPQMHNQNMQIPAFQAPSMGYYHQSPVSRQEAPANGLTAIHHPDHYLYSGPFEYGSHGNSQFSMQYGAVNNQLNPGPVPAHHPIVKVNAMNHEAQAYIPKPGAGHKSLNGAYTKRMVSDASPSSRAPPCDSPAKLQDDSAFSLFHFGGPVAFLSGNKSDNTPPEETFWGFSSNHSADLADSDHCKEEATIEEYNLFSRRFSIF